MPNKACPKCPNKCGPRTKVCPKCNHEFVLKERKIVKPNKTKAVNKAKIETKAKAVNTIKATEKTKKPKRRRKYRRVKTYVDIERWQDLKPDQQIKIKMKGGPYYLSGEERINMGYYGFFQVVSVQDEGFLARPVGRNSDSGMCFIYMGPKKIGITGTHMEPHNILVKNEESTSCQS